MSGFRVGERKMAKSRTMSREQRKAAFQALYQLDARGEDDVELIREGALRDDALHLETGEIEDAFALALEAYRARAQADEAIAEFAPTWPAHRQPAVDRAILRLAWHEMTSGRTNPKVAVNEAVELAKRFSTERSPAFINGVLDKVLKRVLGLKDAESGAATAEDEQAEQERRRRAEGLVEVKPKPPES